MFAPESETEYGDDVDTLIFDLVDSASADLRANLVCFSLRGTFVWFYPLFENSTQPAWTRAEYILLLSYISLGQ